jgi:hypothetical protein
MLGCWGFNEVPWAAAQNLAALPDPPGYAYAGFLIALERVDQVESVTTWAEAMRDVRPGIPIGIMVADQRSTRLAILKARVRWTLVVGREEFSGSPPPAELIRPLLSQTLPFLIVEAWVQMYGEAGGEEGLLQELAEMSAGGHGVGTAVRRLGLSRSSLQRRLKALDYPSPGHLLRQGRVAAYDLRVARGMSRSEAMRLGRWVSPAARDKVTRRLGADRLEVR